MQCVPVECSFLAFSLSAPLDIALVCADRSAANCITFVAPLSCSLLKRHAGLIGELTFSLKPILRFIARLSPALQMNLVCAISYFLRIKCSNTSRSSTAVSRCVASVLPIISAFDAMFGLLLKNGFRVMSLVSR